MVSNGLITCVIILETFLTKYAFIYSKNEKRILKVSKDYTSAVAWHGEKFQNLGKYYTKIE